MNKHARKKTKIFDIHKSKWQLKGVEV